MRRRCSARRGWSKGGYALPVVEAGQNLGGAQDGPIDVPKDMLVRFRIQPVQLVRPRFDPDREVDLLGGVVRGQHGAPARRGIDFGDAPPGQVARQGLRLAVPGWGERIVGVVRVGMADKGDAHTSVFCSAAAVVAHAAPRSWHIWCPGLAPVCLTILPVISIRRCGESVGGRFLALV